MADRFCRHGLATGSNNGTSWENAYQTWAAFIAALADGDVGYVTEHAGIEITSEWDYGSQIEIYFGMPASLTGTDKTLTGRTGYTRFYSNGTSSRRWAFLDGAAADPITLDRLHLEDFYRNDYGGGIYFYRYTAVNLIDCIFDNCKGTTRGGAFYNDATNVAHALNITNTRFLNCKSTEGAAAYFYRAKTVMKNCVVTGCDNSGSAAASILYCSGMTGGFTLNQSTVKGNSSTNIVKGNPVSYIGDSVIYENTGSVAIGNASTITHSCYDATIGGTGHTLTDNTSDDPQFLDTGDDPWQLSESSPTTVTQGGDTGITGYLSTDIFGSNRHATTPSMGAGEYAAAPTGNECTSEGVTASTATGSATVVQKNAATAETSTAATVTGGIIEKIGPLDTLIPNTELYWQPPSNLIVKDIITGEYLLPLVLSGNLTLQKTSTIDGSLSTITKSGGATSHDSKIYAMCQSSDGDLHMIHNYGGDFSYSHLSLSRSGGSVTGWTFDNYIYLPSRTVSGTEEGVPAAIIARNGNGADRLIVAFINGNGNLNYRVQVCHAPLEISASSDFVSLSGTASAWTALAERTQDDMTVNFAGHWFKCAIEAYGSSGNLFVAYGPSGQDDKDDYGCAIEGQRLLASGANWTVDATVETLSANSYESLIGCSCHVDGKAYFSSSNKADQETDGTLRVSKVDTDGTFTASVFPSLSYGPAGTEPNLCVKVTSDERCYLVEAPVDYANTYGDTHCRYHYYDGSSWTSDRFSNVTYDGDRWSGMWGPTDSDEGLICLVSDDASTSFDAAVGYLFVGRADVTQQISAASEGTTAATVTGSATVSNGAATENPATSEGTTAPTVTGSATIGQVNAAQSEGTAAGTVTSSATVSQANTTQASTQTAPTVTSGAEVTQVNAGQSSGETAAGVVSDAVVSQANGAQSSGEISGVVTGAAEVVQVNPSLGITLVGASTINGSASVEQVNAAQSQGGTAAGATSNVTLRQSNPATSAGITGAAVDGFAVVNTSVDNYMVSSGTTAPTAYSSASVMQANAMQSEAIAAATVTSGAEASQVNQSISVAKVYESLAIGDAEVTQANVAQSSGVTAPVVVGLSEVTQENAVSAQGSAASTATGEATMDEENLVQSAAQTAPTATGEATVENYDTNPVASEGLTAAGVTGSATVSQANTVQSTGVTAGTVIGGTEDDSSSVPVKFDFMRRRRTPPIFAF